MVCCSFCRKNDPPGFTSVCTVHLLSGWKIARPAIFFPYYTNTFTDFQTHFMSSSGRPAHCWKNHIFCTWKVHMHETCSSLLTEVFQAARNKWEERDLCWSPARILSNMRWHLMATNDILVTWNVTLSNQFSRGFTMIPAVNKSWHAQLVHYQGYEKPVFQNQFGFIQNCGWQNIKELAGGQQRSLSSLSFSRRLRDHC